MQVINRNWDVKVTAGKYVLGDPCYCFSDSRDGDRDMWAEIGESCGWFEDSPVGILEFEGKEWSILGFGTAYGDGAYLDQFGNIYGVDAGLIGLVPYDLVLALGVVVDETYQKIVEFSCDAVCTVDGGDMTFGEYVINTSEEVEEEDEEVDEETFEEE